MLPILIVTLLATSVPSTWHSAPGTRHSQTPPIVVVVTPEGEIREIVLKDGTVAIGRVERVESGHITFRTASGAVMELEVAQVLAVRPANGRMVNGELWRDDANSTRLFFAPTGRSLKKGEGYFGVYEIMLPFVQVGVTDRISIGGGTPPFFFAESPPFWLTPKVQVVRSKAVDASVGVLHFTNIGDYRMGIAYGVGTHTGTLGSMTIGGGYAYARGDDDGDNGGAPLLMIGGDRQISPRMKVLTENYFFPDGGILTGGFRFMGEKLSVDFGFFSPIGGDIFFVGPMINFVKSF